MSDTAQPKVLIADDEPACIDLVREALADAGCNVIAAEDGEQAWQLIQREKPAVVILDVQMPGCTGFEVFDRIRRDKVLAPTAVVMLTAVTKRTGIKFSGKDMKEYYGSAPEAYLDKPIEPVVLRQVVGKLLKAKAAH
ncbi:MAG: Alkaline phosphatase synthesis transcriptional regulatory protein PhoP [Phycisphaerae bacterium]|nr:Alkaline phosphatase synthesis transcriptional regulatory protein PhoP [Phycisphaerae bacterium]